jgi:hypothetical protein
MKKYIFLFFCFILLFSCAVNNNTGLLTINNQSTININDIKIGDTNVLSYLGKGQKYDLWFTTEISGEMNAKGVNIYSNIDELKTGIEVELAKNYWNTIKIWENSEGKVIMEFNKEENSNN